MDIAAGLLDSFALTDTGDVYKWGNSVLYPTLMDDLQGEKIISISAGMYLYLFVCFVVFVFCFYLCLFFVFVCFNCFILKGWKAMLALSEEGIVFFTGEIYVSDTKLQEDINSLNTKTFIVEELLPHTIVKAVAGANCYIALSSQGKLFSWYKFLSFQFFVLVFCFTCLCCCFIFISLFLPFY